MEFDYGGIIVLAETALALNLTYIGLERFRYRAQIDDRVEKAVAQTKEFERSYTDDLAWLNLQKIPHGNDPRSWTTGHVGYFLYSKNLAIRNIQALPWVMAR